MAQTIEPTAFERLPKLHDEVYLICASHQNSWMTHIFMLVLSINFWFTNALVSSLFQPNVDSLPDKHTIVQK